MRTRPAAALFCCLAFAADLSRQVAALDSERNRAKLAAAAVAIAGSGDAAAIERLADHLEKRAFLKRLDPNGGTDRLADVFQQLRAHPSPATERLCLIVAVSPEFRSLPARMNYLLNALAAVRPVSDAGAKVFRETGASGFFEVNGPLLAANGSTRAIAVLEELISDKNLDPAAKISVAHWSLVPYRIRPEIVEMCARLLDPGRLPADVAAAVVESLFSYRPRQWYGPQMAPPVAPAWSTAGEPAKTAVRHLGRRLLSQPDIDRSLRSAIESTLAEVGRAE